MLYLEHQIISAFRARYRDLVVAYADPIPNLEQRGLDGFFVVADAGGYAGLDEELTRAGGDDLRVV